MTIMPAGCVCHAVIDPLSVNSYTPRRDPQTGLGGLLHACFVPIAVRRQRNHQEHRLCESLPGYHFS